MPMATKIGMVVTYHEGLPARLSHYISTVTVSMATKLDRIATYLDGSLPIKSRDIFITCLEGSRD